MVPKPSGASPVNAAPPRWRSPPPPRLTTEREPPQCGDLGRGRTEAGENMKSIGQNTSHVESIDDRIRAIVREEVACIRLTGATAVYSQRATERPIGCGAATFSRVWHRAFDAGDPGARREGRSLILTADAYGRHQDAVRRRKVTAPPVAPPLSGLDALIAEAGARRTA
jgi:hypothetical protein